MSNTTVVILIIVAVAAMALGGWISFTDSGDSASMTIHKEKMKEDTKAAVEQGEEFLESAADKGENLIEDASGEVDADQADTEKVETTPPRNQP